VKTERQHGRGHSRAAGRDHGLRQIDPRALQLAPDGVGGQEPAVLLIELVVGKIEAAGDVSTPKAGAGLGLGAGEAAARPRVEHLRFSRREVLAHGGEVAHEAPPQARGEGARLRGRRARFHRPVLGPPPRQAAVQHEDLVVAEGAKRPPDARGARHPAAVVDDHAIPAADPQPADALREVRGARQHVRQARRAIRDRVDIEEHRARHVRLRELGARVTLELRHVPGAVDDPDVALAEILGEPFGRHERPDLGPSRGRAHRTTAISGYSRVMRAPRAFRRSSIRS
jgi:hypothetical protein